MTFLVLDIIYKTLFNVTEKRCLLKRKLTF